MKKVRLAILGFGNVSRAVVRYLQEPEPRKTLEEAGMAVLVTGVATGSRGNAIDPEGMSSSALENLGKTRLISSLNRGPETTTNLEFIEKVPADILLVATPASVPSVEEIKAAFARGISVVTSNKTPVANHFRELTARAQQHGVAFRFGATVLAGYPPWRQWFAAITKQEIQEMQIAVNATSNQILTLMLKQGKSFAEGVQRAQELGIAEQDSSDDVEGRDTQKKLVILANVLMGAKLTPDEAPTQGIRNVTLAQLKSAEERGYWIHLLGRAWKDQSGTVRAEVKPVEVQNPFFARMRGTSMGLYFVTPAANFGIWLDLGAGERAIMATAAGVFEDIVAIANNEAGHG